MKWLALQPRDYKFLLICRCYVSHFPYDQILHDWIERVKFEPEWVYFEAEILVQCAHHDEKILAVAFLVQAKALVLQGSKKRALELYSCALSRIDYGAVLQATNMSVRIAEARRECKDMRKLGQSRLCQFTLASGLRFG
jgi:hypothetical protein